ncbi:hypothetical protein HK102_009047 [Quaeritorhiza haematococci]|nr:hypothetical protein HK102_009047 [Quaeritorhiza haematococci]
MKLTSSLLLTLAAALTANAAPGPECDVVGNILRAYNRNPWWSHPGGDCCPGEPGNEVSRGPAGQWGITPSIWCAGQKVLILDWNSLPLNGTFTAEFYKLTSLEELLLDYANLSGPIPNGISALGNLHTFKVRNNSLTSLPDDFAQLTKVTSLDLSSNKFGPNAAADGKFNNVKVCRMTNSGFCELPGVTNPECSGPTPESLQGKLPPCPSSTGNGTQTNGNGTATSAEQPKSTSSATDRDMLGSLTLAVLTAAGTVLLNKW